jgi:hypothetical protein
MQVVKTHLAVVRFLAVATSTAGAGAGALETGCVCVARMVGGLLAAIDAHVDALTGVVKWARGVVWCGVVWCGVEHRMAATPHSLRVMRCGVAHTDGGRAERREATGRGEAFVVEAMREALALLHHICGAMRDFRTRVYPAR